MQQLNATAILPSLGDAYGGCVVDLLDVLHSIVAAVRALGIAGSQYVLEVAAGFLAVVLLCMRIYKYGRDHILKKVRGFMLGEEGFWDRTPKRNIARHIKSLREGIPVLTVANFKGGVGKFHYCGGTQRHSMTARGRECC